MEVLLYPSKCILCHPSISCDGTCLKKDTSARLIGSSANSTFLHNKEKQNDQHKRQNQTQIQQGKANKNTNDQHKIHLLAATHTHTDTHTNKRQRQISKDAEKDTDLLCKSCSSSQGNWNGKVFLNLGPRFHFQSALKCVFVQFHYNGKCDAMWHQLSVWLFMWLESEDAAFIKDIWLVFVLFDVSLGHFCHLQYIYFILTHMYRCEDGSCK